MSYHQYPSLMNIQMTYWTWHLDLAFLGINVYSVLKCTLWECMLFKISLSMARFKYRKDEASSHGGSLSRPISLKDKHDGKKAPQRVTSFKSSFDEYNPFKVIFFSGKLAKEI